MFWNSTQYAEGCNKVHTFDVLHIMIPHSIPYAQAHHHVFFDCGTSLKTLLLPQSAKLSAPRAAAETTAVSS
jgi:hypothetical protein